MNRPAEVGRFYTADEVAHGLVALAGKRSLEQLRVSGGEPTIGKPHLLQLLDRLGCNEEEFSTLTGAKPEGFKMQLRSLERLVDAGVSCHPSIMASFSPSGSLDTLVKRLGRISSELAGQVEIEELILYPHVTNRIQRYGLKYYSSSILG